MIRSETRTLCTGIILRVAFVMLPFVFCGIWIVGCGGGDDLERRTQTQNMRSPAAIPAGLQSELEAWFSEYGETPINYVLGLLAEHDIVLLGEQHRIRHDALFVQELIPQLSAAGVHVFATEFARRVDQPLVDSLMLASQWDERLAREIIFRQFVIWGYREYVDILKAAWQFNRDRLAGTAPLRVVALNHEMDFSYFQSEGDWDNNELWKKVMGSQTEADWARVVLNEVEDGRKVLVHCGIHHAFTGFKQPRVRNGTFTGFIEGRMGNVLREAVGNQAVAVYLHAGWNDSTGTGPTRVHPADGRLDAFMLSRTGGPFAVGFDTAVCPLRNWPIANAIYKYGYDPLTMATFCDGWIYTKPLGEYEVVTYIEDWVTEKNLERARAGSMNPRFREASLEKVISGNKSYMEEYVRFYGHLK